MREEEKKELASPLVFVLSILENKNVRIAMSATELRKILDVCSGKSRPIKAGMYTYRTKTDYTPNVFF